MDGMRRSASTPPQSEGKTPSDHSHPRHPPFFYHFKLGTAGARTYSCGRHLPAGQFVQFTMKPSDGRFSRLPTLPLFHMSPPVSPHPQPGQFECLTLKPPDLLNLTDSADSRVFFLSPSKDISCLNEDWKGKKVFNQCFEMM